MEAIVNTFEDSSSQNPGPEKQRSENRGTETLSHRVRRTLDDLTVIRRSLCATTTQTYGASTEPNSVLDLELAAELKSVVDALRDLLWAYITALSAKSGRKPQEVLEWYKMELAVDMLRKTGSRPAIAATEGPGDPTFQDLITTALAVTAMHAGQEKRI
jgi:hypothetical protein